MRKLNYFLGLVAISSVMFLNSCSKDEDAQGPGLELLSDAEVTTGANSTITIEWRASAGDANLDFFTITEGNTPISGWDEYEIPTAQNESFQSSVTVSIGDDDTQFTLTVTDKDGLTSSEIVTVTVEAALTENGSKELGAAGNTLLGSYYSVASNTVYKTAGINVTTAATIDFVFNSTASAATFISPKAANNSTVSATGRTTKYQKATIAFDAATASDLEAITPTAESITVSANDVIVFLTNDNVKGIFEVTQLTTATDGSVTIGIKVKQ